MGFHDQLMGLGTVLLKKESFTNAINRYIAVCPDSGQFCCRDFTWASLNLINQEVSSYRDSTKKAQDTDDFQWGWIVSDIAKSTFHWCLRRGGKVAKSWNQKKGAMFLHMNIQNLGICETQPGIGWDHSLDWGVDLNRCTTSRYGEPDAVKSY